MKFEYVIIIEFNTSSWIVYSSERYYRCYVVTFERTATVKLRIWYRCYSNQIIMQSLRGWLMASPRSSASFFLSVGRRLSGNVFSAFLSSLISSTPFSGHFTSCKHGSHGSVMWITRIYHADHTDLSRGSHGSITWITRIYHVDHTDLSRGSHGRPRIWAVWGQGQLALISKDY